MKKSCWLSTWSGQTTGLVLWPRYKVERSGKRWCHPMLVYMKHKKAKQNIREGKKGVYLLAINTDFVHKGTRIPLGWCELLQWLLEQTICHVSKQSCCANICIYVWSTEDMWLGKYTSWNKGYFFVQNVYFWGGWVDTKCSAVMSMFDVNEDKILV